MEEKKRNLMIALPLVIGASILILVAIYLAIYH